MTVKAQILRASEREILETEDFQELSIFNCKTNNVSDFNERLNRFSSIILFNGKSINYKIKNNQEALILPLVGEIEINFKKQSKLVSIEKYGWLSSKKNDLITIKNTFDTEPVSFLYLEFVASEKEYFDFKSFQLFQNSFSKIIIDKNHKVQIGIFEARKESQYILENLENEIFAFVINGAFEFENRLIETNDSLRIKGSEIVEFEALSTNAVLLIIETMHL